MNPSTVFIKSKHLWSCLLDAYVPLTFRSDVFNRCYAKKSGDDECRRALVDIPPDVDPKCPQPCERIKKKKPGLLHRIKLRVIEGGTNFGTPFRRVSCKEEEKLPPKKVDTETKALPPPSRPAKVPSMPETRSGVQVSILGADSPLGHYVALLLKQCPCIKKLRLYEAKHCECSACNRNLCKVVKDLQHINTNCLVQAFSSSCNELERCLQNTDIVLMLESSYPNLDLSFEKRFNCQAPIVKNYADAIANECPKAFIIVCTTPIDCMVPLIAETLKETGWYDPRKVLGSLAVPEMRASTLAARALCLEPRYTRVPIVGGTEGESLVPLFSKAVEYFDFAKHNALMMTDAVRGAQTAVTRTDGACVRAADLSEAHALSGLVTKVAHALLCHDIPRVTGFVETDASQVISPARYLAIEVLLNKHGICRKLDLPSDMSLLELELVDLAFEHLKLNVDLAYKWYDALLVGECERCQMAMKTDWHMPRHYRHLDDCASQLT
ncbi:malate dehydrogenase, mitochondrial isoform X1 [Bombyx mori]|uniref:Malate dehydrogenase, mitochondrial n=1 Tax=Bombyx mori TaxID=7091 RepID=A0A8R2AU22_BOMMO|nr:malate dehydrogenase, mitochondrial isoform X1 [Bombyx mori]